MKSVINRITSFMGKNKKRDAEVDCPICLGPLEGEPTIETLCKHNFHRKCLRTWCNTNFESRCPVCRKTITATCTTLNREPQIQAAPIQTPQIQPAPIQAAPIQAPQIQPAPIQANWRDNLDYDNMDWGAYYDQSMRWNNEWEPVFYARWLTRGKPITNHVKILDLGEAVDTRFDDGHTLSLDIEGICTGFPNLEELKLNDNNLESISDCIGSLRKLERLDLNDNNIPTEDVINIFRDPYWDNKRVYLVADGLTVPENRLPHNFIINSRFNRTSIRGRVARQNAGKKRRTNRRTNKRKRSTKTRKHKK